MKLNILSKGMLAIFAFVPLFFAHSYVFQSHLRHGMVEDGSVSQYAGDLLDDRTVVEKYYAVLESDGRANGRYRLGYYVFETLPFFLTVIKNGDYHFGMSGNEIKGCINGDLQFHMIYLLLTIGISLWLGAIIIHKVVGSLLYAALFPLSVIFSSTLVRNITYNDTAEVPQLLGLVGYLVLFFFGELAIRQGKKSGYIYLMLAIPIVVFLYLIKETTVVLFPALFFYLLFFILVREGWNWSKGYYNKKNFIFLVAHLFLNFFLTLWVLFQVHALRGGYASHYEVKSIQQLWDTFIAYGKIFIRFPPSLYIPLLSLFIVICVSVLSKRKPDSIRMEMHYVIGVGLFLMSISLGFLLLNLPWEFIGERYMLPVAFFAALAGAIFVGFLDFWLYTLSKVPRYVGKIVMLAFILTWSYPAGVKEYNSIGQSYEVEFGLHRIINILTNDIIKGTKENGTQQYKVLLDVGNMSYWMWMQAARIINCEARLNVVVPGQKYPQERLYLRHYDNTPEVLLVAADGEGYTSRPFDRVYSAISLSDPTKNKDKTLRLEKLNDNYIIQERWPVSAGPYTKFNIIKYIPRVEG